MNGGWLSVKSIPLGRRLYRHCKNLMSRFTLEGGYRHSGPAYAFNEKSFINALLKADNFLTVHIIIAMGQLVVEN